MDWVIHYLTAPLALVLCQNAKKACLCSVLLLFQGRRGCLLKLRWQLPAGPRCGGGKRRVPCDPHPPSRPDCCSPSLCSDTTTAESRGENPKSGHFLSGDFSFNDILLQLPWVTCRIKRFESREKLSVAFIYSLFKLICCLFKSTLDCVALST